MLDLRLLREHPDEVERRLATKGGAEHVRQIVALDGERRALLRESEELKAERNRSSEAIGQAKRRGEDASAEMARMREVGDRIKALDADLKTLDERIAALALQLPNLPHPSVPDGKGEDDNVEVRRWGTPRQFAFTPKPHEEVGTALGLLDFERAVKIAKSRFTVLWDTAARLERALAQFMLDLHTREHGYTELWVPHLVSGDTMLKTGQLPKFEEGLFKTVEPDDNRTLYLIPTSEVPLTALHSGEILAERHAALALHRLHALLPPRGGHLRQGHEGHLPAAPVRQGRAGQDHHCRPRPTTSWRRWWPTPRRSCGGWSCRIGWSSAARATSASARPRATTSRCGCPGRGGTGRSPPAPTTTRSGDGAWTSATGRQAVAGSSRVRP